MRRRKSERDPRTSVRLWLRMLACTNLIEARIRSRLREQFHSTLPRFDMLAQLDAARDSGDGLTMSELSERLMVSNGNLTGLTERLVKEGLVSRRAPDNDRRMQRIRLTAAGKRALNAMTPGHHRWINEMFDGMGAHEREQLYELMGELKRSVQTACQKNPQVRSCLPRPGPGAPAR